MLSKLDISNKLSLVAKGQLDVWAFHTWLQGASWNMHKDSSEDAMELVEDIKLAFEEYYSGKKDEEALVSCLAGIPIVYVSFAAMTGTKRIVLPYRDVLMLPSPHQEMAFA